MSDTEIDYGALYAAAEALETTEQRIVFFGQQQFELTPLDNYDVTPGSDPVFERGWHRWLFLFQCTKGVERAAIMNIAFELHRSNPNPHLHGVGFFSHGFSDSTRDFYYAKAMCLAYRELVGQEED